MSHKWRGLRRPRHLWDVDVVSDTEGHMYLTPTILASYLGFPLPKRRAEINKKKKKEEKEEEKKKGIEEKKKFLFFSFFFSFFFFDLLL